MPRISIEERFWSKVDKTSNPNGCWEWTAARLPKGYGKFGVPTGGWMLAHRYSRELHNGPIPDGMLVCHRCDNRRCVNPGHLFLGTAKDNTQDMISKGRVAIGTRISSSKLNPSAVRIIRKLIAAGGISQREIGERFGVSQGTIHNINDGRSWAWVK